MDHNLNEEQCESIQGILSEDWKPMNAPANNTQLENQQQVFQIFQNPQARINNTRSFDNFNMGPEFQNNNQFFQNQPNNFIGLPQTGGQVNPEINEITSQFNQFSLMNYDTGESEFIFNNGAPNNNNNNNNSGNNNQVNNNSYSQF